LNLGCTIHIAIQYQGRKGNSVLGASLPWVQSLIRLNGEK